MLNSEQQRRLEDLVGDIDTLSNIPDPEVRKKVATIVRDPQTPLNKITEQLQLAGLTDPETLNDVTYLALLRLSEKIGYATGPIKLRNAVIPNHDIEVFLDACENDQGRLSTNRRSPEIINLINQGRNINELLSDTHPNYQNLKLSEINAQIRSLDSIIGRLERVTAGLGGNAHHRPTSFPAGMKAVHPLEILNLSGIRRFARNLIGQPIGSRDKIIAEMVLSICDSTETKRVIAANTVGARAMIKNLPTMNEGIKLVNQAEHLVNYDNEKLLGQEADKIKNAIKDVRDKIDKIESLNILELETFNKNYGIVEKMVNAATPDSLRNKAAATRADISRLEAERGAFTTSYNALRARAESQNHKLLTEEDMFMAEYKQEFISADRFNEYFGKEEIEGFSDEVKDTLKRYTRGTSNSYDSVLRGLYKDVLNQATLLKLEVKSGLIGPAEILAEIKKFAKTAGDKIDPQVKTITDLLLSKLDSEPAMEKLKEAWKEIRKAEQEFIKAMSVENVGPEQVDQARDKLKSAYDQLYNIEKELFTDGGAAVIREKIRNNYGKAYHRMHHIGANVQTLLDDLDQEINNLISRRDAANQLFSRQTDDNLKERIRMEIIDINDRIAKLQELKKAKKLEMRSFRAQSVQIPGRAHLNQVRKNVDEISASQFPLRGWRYSLSANMGTLRYRNWRKSKNIYKKDRQVALYLQQVRDRQLFHQGKMWDRIWDDRREKVIGKRISKYQAAISFHNQKIEAKAAKTKSQEQIELLKKKYAKGVGGIISPRIQIPENDPIWESTNVDRALKLMAALAKATAPSTPPVRTTINALRAELRTLLNNTKQKNQEAIEKLLTGRFAEQTKIEEEKKQAKEGEEATIKKQFQALKTLGLSDTMYKEETALKDPDKAQWLEYAKNRTLNTQASADLFKTFFAFVNKLDDKTKSAYKFKVEHLATLYKLKHKNPDKIDIMEDFEADYDKVKNDPAATIGTTPAHRIVSITDYLEYRNINDII